MIIEAPYTVGDVVTVKLSSGEELIARLAAEDNAHATLSKPMSLVATEQGLGLAPFIFSISPDTKVKIKINNVICIVKTAKDAADTYTKQTSGLTV